MSVTEAILTILFYVALSVLIGCLWGLIPFYLGRSRYRPNTGRWGLIFCGIAGPLGLFWSGTDGSIALPFFVMLGFVVGILISGHDMRPPQQRSQQQQPQQQQRPGQYVQPAAGGLTLTCLAGPLKGQSYPLGRDGLMFGRDNDCTVHFPAETGGISRHHCSLSWQQGVPVLTDLGSAYGTFLGDGRQLPPHYPTSVGPGSRFYLATPANLFQISTL
ncbi:MAG: FHA domain-containing protein [Clostridiales bacterium]|nr:FHA domain-containing protein [Clostridiales bacterium]